MSSNLDCIKENINNINPVLQHYRNELVNLNTHLALTGKAIDKACIEQTGWYSFYDVKKVELRIIYEYVESKLTQIHSILWKKLTENHNRDLSQRDKDIYIKHDLSYIDMEIIVLHTKEVYELYVSAVESFKIRGYVLNNLTRLRIAEQEDWII